MYVRRLRAKWTMDSNDDDSNNGTHHQNSLATRCTGLVLLVSVYLSGLFACIIAGATAPDLFTATTTSPPSGISSASGNYAFPTTGFKVRRMQAWLSVCRCLAGGFSSRPYARTCLLSTTGKKWLILLYSVWSPGFCCFAACCYYCGLVVFYMYDCRCAADRLSASTSGMGPLCLMCVAGEAGRVSVGADPRADATNSRSLPLNRAS